LKSANIKKIEKTDPGPSTVSATASDTDKKAPSLQMTSPQSKPIKIKKKKLMGKDHSKMGAVLKIANSIKSRGGMLT